MMVFLEWGWGISTDATLLHCTIGVIIVTLDGQSKACSLRCTILGSII